LATLDDLFGSKAAPQPKWTTIGDTHVGVITKEPYVAQEVDWTTKKKKFFVEQDGKWKLALEGEFDESLNHSPVNQIVVPVQLKDGSLATFYMSGQRKEALKEAMEESGAPLDVGSTIGVKYLKDEKGKGPIPKKVYAVKLVQ
jgi:hypothetical protein